MDLQVDALMDIICSFGVEKMYGREKHLFSFFLFWSGSLAEPIESQNMSTWQGLFALVVCIGFITQSTAQAEKVEVTWS